MMYTLYIVATPIGNLEDVTLRAVRILKEVNLIAAEDTRTTRKLLKRYDIQTPMVSYYEGNRSLRIPFLVERLQREDIALVSEAGMPGIRDPGYELVRAAVQAGATVVPLPGASAVTAALAVSGLPSDQFLFLGFLPSRRKERLEALHLVSSQPYTLVIFEAPHRLQASLKDMVVRLGAERRIAVCRELTKLHEEVYRGTILEALAHFEHPRGEFTLVIAGASEKKEPEDLIMGEVRDTLQRMRVAGVPSREAVSQVAGRYDLSRRRVYQLWVTLSKG